jgi:hypothetical protein
MCRPQRIAENELFDITGRPRVPNKMTSTTTTTMSTFKNPENICENCCEDKAVKDEDGDLLCTCDLCEDCGDEVGWVHIIVHSFGCVGLCTRCSLKNGPHCPRTHSNHEHDPCEFCVSAYKQQDDEDEDEGEEAQERERQHAKDYDTDGSTTEEDE